MFSPEAKEILISNYRKLLEDHGEGPEVAHYKSVESQVMRFEQLAKLGDMTGGRVLEVGCGIGDFYSYLQQNFADLNYKGIDIVPEIIAVAQKRFPSADFECRDILSEPLTDDYDYVLISGVFNNAIPDQLDFLKALTEASFKRAKTGLGFNFISTYVNYTEDDFAYFDPCEVLNWCLNGLSRKTNMFHHYKRTDVCVFVYREA